MMKHERLPFEVIVSATEGDPEAIATVLNFYDGYISKLCLRKLYDEHGNVCMVVDADLKNRVQTAFRCKQCREPSGKNFQGHP